MKTGMAKRNPWLGLTLATMLLAGCSDTPKTETAKQPEKAPEPVTGRQAFQMMYPQARRWAADAQPFQLRSIHLSQVKSQKGKAGAWQAIFVSPSQSKSRTYTYSVVEAEGNLHEGVYGSIEEGYTPQASSSPFEIAAIRIDSDQAYDTAAEKSRDYIQKNPSKPISFLLEQTKRYPDVTWRVIWGESVGTSDYSVFVDASTGAILGIVH
jgi:hypothetical protein